jgi:hypothetical protein
MMQKLTGGSAARPVEDEDAGRPGDPCDYPSNFTDAQEARHRNFFFDRSHELPRHLCSSSVSAIVGAILLQLVVGLGDSNSNQPDYDDGQISLAEGSRSNEWR